jgi:hypothetical protein
MSYAAFCIYRDLPVYGEITRSLSTVATQLGYADISGLGLWSRKYDWVARTQAYDAYKASKAISIREVSQEQFAQQVLIGTSARIAMIHQILDTNLGRIIKNQQDDDTYILDASDLKAVTGVVKVLDDLNRRAAGLPTSYGRELGKDVPDDDQVYILGGEDA